MSCDLSKFTGNMKAVDVLRVQMDDMLKGNTLKAYQLASPTNRKSTANQYNIQKFDTMVRSPNYNPLLHAQDYSYITTSKTDCEEKFDVLLYDEDVSEPKHGYEFLLSRQTEEDLHESLKDYTLPIDSQYWRTDHVLPIPENELKEKHRNMMHLRQQSYRKACFKDKYNHSSVQHSFGADMTHNLCCKLGEAAKDYSNKSNNPIGNAAKKIKSDNWSTCMGSNVCSYYAETQNDGTMPLFATSPDLYKLSAYVPPNIHCEAFAAEELSMTSHGTPGIATQGRSELCSAEEKELIKQNTYTKHKNIQKVIENMSINN